MRQFIGFLVVPQAMVLRTQYEVAAWHSDMLVPAGRYPIFEGREARSGRESDRRWWGIKLPGTVVSAYTPSLLCGVAVGSSPQGEQHRDVGRADTHSIYWDDFALGGVAHQLMESGTVSIYDRDRKAVACRVELFGVVPAVDYRYWSLWSDPRLKVVEGRYHWSEGLRGQWKTVYTMRPQLLLQAGAQ